MEQYKDSSLKPSLRAKDLLGRMTLREKIGQINQRLYGFSVYERNGEEITLSEELKEEVKRYGGLGVLYGLYRADPWSGRTESTGLKGRLAPKAYNMVQRYVIEHSRFGIPVLMSSECPHGHQALDGYLLPVNLASAASFHPELLKRAGAVCGAQLAEMGVDLALVSMLDILRDPRWGRSEECFGEDPYLAGVMAKALTEGMQDKGVAVVAKHFCAQGEGTGGVNASAARIGMRELREIHLPAAKACCAAGVKGIMAAYNEIDGVFCHVNKELLTDILRGEFGFRGIIMADGVALDQLDPMTGDNVVSGAAARKAGVDVGLWDTAFSKLDQAIDRGLITEQDLDEAVLRVLTLKFERGLFEHPYLEENRDGSEYTVSRYPEALELARESVILLKNDGNTLPLSAVSGSAGESGKTGRDESRTQGRAGRRKLAVIGPNADDLYAQLGDYTPPVDRTSGITALDGIRMLAPEYGYETVYCAGTDIGEARELAGESEAVILVLGGSSSRFGGGEFADNGAAIGSAGVMDCGENVDTARIVLPGSQEELFRAVCEAGRPVITVLIQGRPYAVPEIARDSAALLMSFYPGMSGGQAIAEILFGRISPSGRLPVSVPKHAGQIPVYYNFKSSYKGMNYRDMDNDRPLYCFGEGFGYSRMEYGDFSLDRRSVSRAELTKITVSATIHNTGDYDEYAVPQLYIRDMAASTVRRVRELKAFDKIMVPKGESRTAVLTLDEESLSIWDSRMQFTAEPGIFELMLMDSGRLLWQTEFELTE